MIWGDCYIFNLMMIAITVVIAVMILIIRLMKIMMIAIADDCGYDIDH